MKWPIILMSIELTRSPSLSLSLSRTHTVLFSFHHTQILSITHAHSFIRKLFLSHTHSSPSHTHKKHTDQFSLFLSHSFFFLCVCVCVCVNQLEILCYWMFSLKVNFTWQSNFGVSNFFCRFGDSKFFPFLTLFHSFSLTKFPLSHLSPTLPLSHFLSHWHTQK